MPPCLARPSLALLLVLAGLAAPALARDEGAAPVPAAPTAAERAAALDRLIDGADAGVTAERVDDRTWLRRLALDVLGRLPTLDETAAFLVDREPDRDGRWVDRWLDAPGHRSRMQTWWSDLLRARSDLARRTSGEPLRHWIRDRLERGVPYDEMVTELLTAEGPAHAPDNGATGFLLRDREMPEDSMANTARVFLGTRIECAQCHDHPFEPWTREQFFGMVAFTGGLEYEVDVDDLPVGSAADALAEQLRREQGGRVKQPIKRVLRPVTNGLSGSGTASVRLPDEHGEPTDTWVHATTILDGVPGPAVERPAPTRKQRRRGREPEPLPVDSRAALASWMTAPENPRFHRVLANRLWSLVFGRGLVEPLDDLRPDVAPSHPALLDALEQLVLDLDHDVDAVLAVLLRTRAYRRLAAPADTPWQQPPTAPVVRRLAAEQIWDALLTLAKPDVDQTLGPARHHAAAEVYAEYEALAAADRQTLAALVEREVLRRTDKDAFRALRDAERKGQRQQRQERKGLLRELRGARVEGDRERMDDLGAALSARGLDPEGPRPVSKKDLVRASELPSPAPPGHLLAVFGQSTGELVDGARREANVPQALTLLNGFVDEHLLGRRQAALARALKPLRRPGQRVDACFAAVLCREPSVEERALWTAVLDADLRQGSEDLVWTLVNSHEFLFTR